MRAIIVILFCLNTIGCVVRVSPTTRNEHQEERNDERFNRPEHRK